MLTYVIEREQETLGRSLESSRISDENVPKFLWRLEKGDAVPGHHCLFADKKAQYRTAAGGCSSNIYSENWELQRIALTHNDSKETECLYISFPVS